MAGGFEVVELLESHVLEFAGNLLSEVQEKLSGGRLLQEVLCWEAASGGGGAGGRAHGSCRQHLSSQPCCLSLTPGQLAEDRYSEGSTPFSRSHQ